MTRLDFDLSSFSIKRRGWKDTVVIDLSGSDKYVILVGPNAGGKTLTMKALAMFSDTMADPNKRKLIALERLVREADILQMRVEFGYDFMHAIDGMERTDGETKIPWIRLKRRHGEPKRIDMDSPKSRWEGLSQSVDSEIDSDREGTIITGRVIVEHVLRFNSKTDKTLISKNEGIRFKIIPNAGWGDLEPYEEGMEFPLMGIATQEKDLLDWPLEEGFSSFGSSDPFGTNWRRDAEVLAGLRFRRFDDVSATKWAPNDEYAYYNANKMIRFNTNVPQFHEISDAYDFRNENKEPIRALFDEKKIRDSIAKIFEKRYFDLLRERFTHDFVKESVYKRILLEDIFAEEGKEEMTPEDWKDLEKKRDGRLIEQTHNQKMALLHRYARRNGAADDETRIVDESQFRERMAVDLARKDFLDGPQLIMATMHGSEELQAKIKQISDYNPGDIGTCPIPLEASELTNATKSRAIRENPELGIALFLRDFLEKIPETPSSGQKRILSMVEDLILLPPGSTVLIDEPELSLHLEWQEKIISSLTNSLPHLSFIIATHSPNIVKGHTEMIEPVPPRNDRD